MNLEEAYLIDQKPVKKEKGFLGFQVYSVIEKDDEEMVLFLVKGGKVLGKITAESFGGAENSSSVDLTLSEIHE